MADSSLVPPLENHHDATEINNDLDKMIENMELMSGGAPHPPLILYYPLPSLYLYYSQRTHASVLCPSVVQLTWMAYDMAVLRTNPELEASMRSLQEAYQRCKSVVLTAKQPQMDSSL